MPIVPIEDNKVGLASATDAKFRAPDTSGSGLEALGAGLAQLGAGGQQFASGIEERRRAAQAIAAAMLDDRHRGNIDDAAAKRAYVAYRDGATSLLNGDDGLFNKQGAEAHAAFPDVVLGLTDVHDAAKASLDDIQRSVVAPAMNEQLRSDVARAADHVRQQGEIERQRRSADLQQAAARDAVNHADDPDLHDHHLMTGEKAIRQQAKIDKVGDKLLHKQIADYRSGVHADTIDVLTRRDPVHAAEWYARYDGNLNQRDKMRVEARLGPALAGAGTGGDGAAEFADVKNALAAPGVSDDPALTSAGRLGTALTVPASLMAMWRGGPSRPMLALLDQADAQSSPPQSNASDALLPPSASQGQSSVGTATDAESAVATEPGPDIVVRARRQQRRPRALPQVAAAKPKPPSPPPLPVKPDRGAERAAQWAYEKKGSSEYREYGFDSRVGGTKGWIAGYSAPKCNFFVHDALAQGGIPQTTVNGQRRIALAGDWGNRSSVIPGFRPLNVDENGRRLEPVRKGDIVSNGGHVGMVVGVPYKGRAKYVVASAADPDHGDTVTLTEFGFRPEDNPRNEKFKIVIWRHVSH